MTIDHRLLEKTLGLLCTMQTFSFIQLCGGSAELAVAAACGIYLLTPPLARRLWTLQRTAAVNA